VINNHINETPGNCKNLHG